jgi:hypothetical protein
LSLLKKISAMMRALVLLVSVLLAWNSLLAQSLTAPPLLSPSSVGRIPMAVRSSATLNSTPDASSTYALSDAPAADALPQTTSQDSNPPGKGEGVVQVVDRKSQVFPDIATNTGRLDSWGKFKLAAHNSVSLSTIGVALIASGYGQATNSPPGYGQGGDGYAKRFGAIMGRDASSNIFGNFVIASVLHEDPRFYVKKDLSFMQSVKYSASRVFAAQSDSGGQMVDFAGLLGPLAAEALANTYYPKGNREVGDALVRYGYDQAWRFGANLLRQYWPTIEKKLRHKPPAAEPASPPKNQ